MWQAARAKDPHVQWWKVSLGDVDIPQVSLLHHTFVMFVSVSGGWCCDLVVSVMKHAWCLCKLGRSREVYD